MNVKNKVKPQGNKMTSIGASMKVMLYSAMTMMMMTTGFKAAAAEANIEETHQQQRRTTSVLLEPVDAMVDIVFLMDLSGSFVSDINGLKPLMEGLITNIENLFVDPSTNLKIGLAGFQDYLGAPFGFMGDRPYFQILDLGTSKAEFVQEFGSLVATGGGDFSESQLAALFQASTGLGQVVAEDDDPRKELKDIPAGQGMSWRCGARKLILLYTDATFHRSENEPDYPGPTTEETVGALLNPIVTDPPAEESTQVCDPISVIGLSRGEQGVDDLKDIALATGAVAGPNGVRCDDTDEQIIAEGEPIVCTGITGAGAVISDAISGIIEGELATCEPGTVLRNNACIPCPLGRYEVDGFCRPCPLGTVAATVGSSQCIFCDDGFIEIGDRITCEECPAGTCKAGTLNECVPCEPGLFQPKTGQGFCLHCPRGTFTDDEGNVACTQCPANFVQPLRGQTSCNECPDGTIEGPRDRCVDA